MGPGGSAAGRPPAASAQPVGTDRIGREVGAWGHGTGVSRVGRPHGLQQTTTSTRKEMAHMESRAKLAGHAIHPMLITLPLGLLGTAVVFDIIRAFTNEADLAVASFYMLAAGILGLLARRAIRADRLAGHPGRDPGQGHR